ncbi:hypothetical protein [Streptomyces sp. ICBB 8177]|uniref:hypothetical protein n=1 Tax=Streptomyces sp. ICBB 8177 TaxID=563922 RepID=UPI000D67C587|nr:hypothetical protein [Streptomyces sp. ICBB 8177]PWI45075.1 hypothetical protein CK485_07870 [Streptomyces sp. ICBB 8177]
MQNLAAVKATPRATAIPRRLPVADVPLAAVALFYVVVQLVLTDVGRASLSWDESIYFSQVDPRAPAAYFSAPRSRGPSLIAAPVALFTSDPMAIRIYLAVLSGVLLLAVFRIWSPLIGAGASALAALLFATLWVTVDYGTQLMPNIWSAFAAVAAVGLFVRMGRDGPSSGRLAGLAVSLACAALIRAPDGVWLAVPLLTAWALVGRWRRITIGAAIVCGLASGLAEWVIEAYVRFGGVRARLTDSNAVEGGLNPHWNVGNALRTANGPLLCRPCLFNYPQPTRFAWLIAVPLLTLIALVWAVRARRLATTLLPVVCAVCVSASYLFFLTYFAPRFLLPAYALLSLPIAQAAMAAIGRVRTEPTGARLLCLVAVGLLFAGHLASQAVMERGHASAAVRLDGRYRALANALRSHGVRPPCLLSGNTTTIAYDAGCSSSLSPRPATDSSVAAGPPVIEASHHESVAVLAPPGHPRPAWVPTSWQRIALAGSPLVHGWSAWLPPRS